MSQLLLADDSSGDGLLLEDDVEVGLMLEDNDDDDELQLEDNASESSDELLLEDNPVSDDSNEQTLLLEDNAADDGSSESALHNWNDAFHILYPSEGASGVITAASTSLGLAPPPERAALTKARLTFAATVAWAIGQLPECEATELARGRGRDNRLLLWLVGARESMEGELARGGHLAEPLLQLLPPALRRIGIELVLIGPEMQTWEIETRGGATQPSVVVRAICGTLHAAVAPTPTADGGVVGTMVGGSGGGGSGSGSATPSSSQPLERPNACVLFNSGIGTLLWPLVEAWIPTLAHLLALDVPMLLTCFNAREAEGEETVLSNAFKCRVLLSKRPNPLAFVAPAICVQATTAADANAEARAAELAAEDAALDEAAHAAGAAAAAREEAGSTAAQLAEMRAIDAHGRASVEASHRWIKWVRGSEYSAPQLSGEASARAEELVKTCAKLFAIKNMEHWVEHLDAKGEADHATPNLDAGETIGANVMLIAEAVEETQLALYAHGKGATAALKRTLLRWASLAPERALSEADSSSSSKRSGRSTGGDRLTYAGLPAAVRIVRGATEALRSIEAAVAQVQATQRPPEEAEVLLPGGVATFRNVFVGTYINARAEPSTASPVVAQLPKGATVKGDATRGDWLRLVGGEHGLPPRAGGQRPAWLLMRHPVHGQLVDRDEEEI